MVQIGLGDLGDHVVLKNRPPEWMGNDLGRLTDAQKLAEQTCIVEIKLGAFDDSLVEVPVMRREQEDDEACLKHEDPAARRVNGNAAVRCQARVAKELTGSAGAKRQEPFEHIEIADVRQAPHIALNVGLDVVREPNLRGDLAVVDPWIKTCAQSLPKVEARRMIAEESYRRIRVCLFLPLQFGSGEGHQVEDAAPAGQCLRDPAHQQEIVGPREDKPAGRGVLVDRALNVGQQVRDMLNLVDDHRVVKLAQEPQRIFPGETSLVYLFERHVAI